MIEIRGNSQAVRGLSIYGGGAPGSGRGIQVGRAGADTTGQPVERIIIEDIYMEAMPGYGIAFYGNAPSLEAREDSPKTSVSANSITFDSVVNRVFMLGNKAKGGIYIGQGCTTISVRDSRVVGWDGGPGVKIRGAIGCQFDRVILEDPHTDQNYLYLDFADHCVFINCWFEQNKAYSPRSYMIALTDISRMNTFIAPFFSRPAGNGATLFLSADGSCHATLLLNPSAQMGTKSTGTSISKGGSDLTILGYQKIEQPDGLIDMVVK